MGALGALAAAFFAAGTTFLTGYSSSISSTEEGTGDLALEALEAFLAGAFLAAAALALGALEGGRWRCGGVGGVREEKVVCEWV